MTPRRNNQPASWELNADQPKPRGESRVRRSYCSTELVQSELGAHARSRTAHQEHEHRFADTQLRSFAGPAHGVDTVHDIMLYASRMYGDKQGFGTREILEVYNDPLPGPSLSSAETSSASLRSGRSTASGATGATGATGTTGASGRSAPKPVGQTGERYRLSPLQWLSYADALQEVRDLGSGLRELGFGTHGQKGFFSLYSATS